MSAGGRPLRPRLARSLALAAVRPGLAVVDIGCGRGETATHLSRRGATVTAVDYSTGALSLTRTTCNQVLETAERRDRVKLVAADASNLPLADGSVDRVLLLDIVEHLHPAQLRSTLLETRRILAMDGYVVVHTLPNRWALDWAYPLMRLADRRLPAQPRSEYERAVHVNEQDPRSLRRALQEAGLSSRVWVEEWTTVHASFGARLEFHDAVRSSGYPVLRRKWIRRAIELIMASPAGWVVGNDIFALAWRPNGHEPPELGRFRPVRRHALTRRSVRE